MFARPTAVRAVARQGRNFSSTTAARAATPEKASSTVNDIAKRAQELGGPAMKKVEGLLGGYSEPIKYNLSVASNIAKQVYVAEGLAPPTSINTITSAYRQIWSKASDKSYWTQLLTKGNWKKVGIYAVEAYGIFTIGEMIGRRSLVGYKLDTSKHAHHAHH
ncbi:related to ATP20 - subunit G of mitochondrial F1F0-ATP Synthase [Melanopsichium pennsylvanicum]|uniref:Related to ATP20 - subunit G of mitochondrial F1F0-ATP Synthase n=2 Tax=Melanopsichium pennsylvanicum TaxID=63383 RepID=A0AAJ5C394_9BASI|nr:related to ATP20-subunit G of mitochondrial F1F0-ATP Synthase [Melanopsichium pennsylvanicum 4]SNX82352.1 related to ATP20 - subunit G of mitochondrial F1F0-ATP Synthase [Melanopsichium pennsylvanicum]